MIELDALKESIRLIIDHAMRRVDYFALYPAKVVSQNADRTLELKPESSKLPQMSKVPIRLGIPGASVRVSAGARVLVGFENGDPKRPYAGLWDTASLVELVIDGGSNAVARVGSTTQGHVHSGTAGPYPVSLFTATDTIANGFDKMKVP